MYLLKSETLAVDTLSGIFSDMSESYNRPSLQREAVRRITT